MISDDEGRHAGSEGARLWAERVEREEREQAAAEAFRSALADGVLVLAHDVYRRTSLFRIDTGADGYELHELDGSMSAHVATTASLDAAFSALADRLRERELAIVELQPTATTPMEGLLRAFSVGGPPAAPMVEVDGRAAAIAEVDGVSYLTPVDPERWVGYRQRDGLAAAVSSLYLVAGPCGFVPVGFFTAQADGWAACNRALRDTPLLVIDRTDSEEMTDRTEVYLDERFTIRHQGQVIDDVDGDLASLIRSNPMLHEVRSSVHTRIALSPAAGLDANELAYLLVPVDDSSSAEPYEPAEPLPDGFVGEGLEIDGKRWSWCETTDGDLVPLCLGEDGIGPEARWWAVARHQWDGFPAGASRFEIGEASPQLVVQVDWIDDLGAKVRVTRMDGDPDVSEHIIEWIERIGPLGYDFPTALVEELVDPGGRLQSGSDEFVTLQLDDADRTALATRIRGSALGRRMEYLESHVAVFEGGRWVPAHESDIVETSPVHVITAWNPGDERPGRAANDAAHRRLHDVLVELGTEPVLARGSDAHSDHYEDGWAVAGLSHDTARKIGTQFGQVAIFWITDSDQYVVACSEEWTASRPLRP